MKVSGVMEATLQVLRKNNSCFPSNRQNVLTQKGIRQDIISISAKDQSKSGSKSKTLEMIDTLNEQIKTIRESKNALVRETLDAGKSLKLIEPQLKNFDEQIKNIGEMITKINADELMEAKEKTEKPVQDKEPVTKEEAEAKKLSNVVSLSASVENIENLNAIKVATKAYAKIVETQITLDKSMVYHHNDGTTQPISAVPKEELLARLEQSATSLNSAIGDILGEVQNTVKEQDTAKIEDNEKQDNENPDGVINPQLTMENGKLIMDN